MMHKTKSGSSTYLYHQRWQCWVCKRQSKTWHELGPEREFIRRKDDV